ncbi:MAG: hypothetical protein AB1Z98_38585, partial [Nannocystaceae bacterium]
LEAFREADQKRRDYLQQAETLRHKRNVVSEQVAELKKAGETADDIVAEMRTVSAQIKTLEKELSANEEIVRSILMGLPNIPHASVPARWRGDRRVKATTRSRISRTRYAQSTSPGARPDCCCARPEETPMTP